MGNKVTNKTVEDNLIALNEKAKSSENNGLKDLIREILNQYQGNKFQDKEALNSYITLINEIIQHTLDIEASQQFLKKNPLLGWVRKPGDAYVYKNVNLNETIDSIWDIFNSLSKSITPADNLKILHEIKILSSNLPDSKYKDTLNTFWYAFMVFSIGMAAFICPPLIPFAIPVIGFMTSLNFMVGSIAMGMACHFGLKSFFDHAHHEEYKKTELEILSLINSELRTDDQIKPMFETAYRKIEKEKETSPIKASQALKKIKTLLQDFKEKKVKSNILGDKLNDITNNINKNNSLLTSIQAGLSTAKNKYGWLLLIGVALTIADGFFTVTNGALGVLGISMLVGFAATVLYEACAAAKRLVGSPPSSTTQYKEQIDQMNHGTVQTLDSDFVDNRSSIG